MSEVIVANLKAEEEPAAVLGLGQDRFEVGKLVWRDDFEDLKNWVVQIQKRDGFPEARVETNNGTLDCYLPGRGCTIWFKNKLKTRMMICYDVVCPKPDKEVAGIMPRDVNQFWLASDPNDPEKGLFNAQRYTGEFGDYHEMNGYYASSGGGRNTTTRFRRYPRQEDGDHERHIALKSRDGDPNFLITPGKKMRVRLVAFDDLIQYIVDDQLVYEIAYGDEVNVERERRGEIADRKYHYSSSRFEYYKQGFFGFRMVQTHHQYSNFRVYELQSKPIVRRDVTVASIDELRQVARRRHVDVKMAPGTYVLDAPKSGEAAISFNGSDNTYDFSGVTFEMPIAVLSEICDKNRRNRAKSYEINGNNIVIKGGTFVNTYPYDLPEEIDFGSYNQNPDNYPSGTAFEMHVRGDHVRLEGCKMIVRGSSPYGYGNIYGIGGGHVVPLHKHSGILVHGDHAVLDGCNVKMEAFGHAIFTQYGDDILVKNCYVEGEVRPSNDFHEETDAGSLAKRFNHEVQWPESVKGWKVPRDRMMNLAEDGIRAYNGTGKITVENCKVVRMRGGIKLYMADKATIRNCEVLDCVIQGFSVPSRGVIESCRGNAAYGPLLYIHSDGHTDQKIDIEVLPAPHGIGRHPLAAIKGGNHTITFTSGDGDGAQFERPIIVGFPLRFDFLTVDYPKVPEGLEKLFERFAPDSYRAEKIALENQTKYPVLLSKQSENNRIKSVGPIRDQGTNNKRIDSDD